MSAVGDKPFGYKTLWRINRGRMAAFMSYGNRGWHESKSGHCTTNTKANIKISMAVHQSRHVSSDTIANVSGYDFTGAPAGCRH